jgi:mannose-1-phosphate guanylyltransferase
LLDADRFLIINGDTLTDCDVRALVDRHESSGAHVTMALVPGDVARYGGAIVGEDGFVHGFTRGRGSAAPVTHEAPAAPVAHGAHVAPEAPEAPETSVFHFIGVQAVDASAFASLADDRPAETVRTLYPELMAGRPNSVAAFVSQAEFLDIGTARDYLQTVSLIADREGRPFDRGEACRLAPDAAVSHTILWDRVTVGRGAHLNRCIVADDVTVPDGARYEHAVLVAGDDGLIVEHL